MSQELQMVNIRLVKEPSLYSEKEVRTAQDALVLLAKELSQYDREVLCILNLKSNNQVINASFVSVGTLNSAPVAMRDIFKCSILSNAASIIILHNHPSSSLKVSEYDARVTAEMKEAGELLGIELLDHIVVAGETGKMWSFRENNWFDDPIKSYNKSKAWER